MEVDRLLKVFHLNSKKLSELVIQELEDMKAESIRCINVRKLTEITDYMVIATGRSSTHNKAMADAVDKKVKEAGVNVVGVEGKMQSEWVLIDVGDVVVHLMLAPVRALYNLEDLWSFGNSKVEAGKESERSS
jgi:ribosome-associated protein